MRFWDSSAIIPLCLKEPASHEVGRLVKADEDLVVWWVTRVECLSALSRQRREGAIGTEAELKAKAILSLLLSAWTEIQPSDPVRLRAERLVATHPLRAGDALQLAAALIWAQETPQDLEFVCLDQNLRHAALKEGFTVLP